MHTRQCAIQSDVCVTVMRVCVRVCVALLFDHATMDQAGILWFWNPVWVTIRQTDRTEGAPDVKPQTNLLMVLSPAKGAYRAPVDPGGFPDVHSML